MADQRPIPTASNKQAETLTRLTLRAIRRRHRRYIAIRNATREMGQLVALLHTAAVDERVDSGTRLMRDLRAVIATLMHRIDEIQQEEDGDRAREWELWRGVY